MYNSLTMRPISDSYSETRKNTPCQFAHESDSDEPCWGRVLPITSTEDEDFDLDPEENFTIVWACEGHEDRPFDAPYIHEAQFE
jgi:hypothetical protein